MVLQKVKFQVLFFLIRSRFPVQFRAILQDRSENHPHQNSQPNKSDYPKQAFGPPQTHKTNHFRTHYDWLALLFIDHKVKLPVQVH